MVSKLTRAAVCFFLAGLWGGGLLSVAAAQEPPVAMKLLDASGHAVGSQAPTIQVKVTGNVLDAETGRPLPAFHVTTGAQDRDRRSFDWTEQGPLLFTKGAFTVLLAKEGMPPAVLIEAEGYLPQCSGPIRGLETNLIFQLKKGGGPAGVVLTPEGHPAAGRTVYLSRTKDLLYLEGTNLTPRKASARLRSTTTDPAGRFSFAPDLDAFSVVVADDAGFADVPVLELTSSPRVRLQPWARVEGTLNMGAKAGPNETVRLVGAFAMFAYYPRPMPPYAIKVATTTDAAGRFVFPRVPPVDVKLCHLPKVGQAGDDRLPITQITNCALKAGETRFVTLGGQGRPVVGRVVLKNYPKSLDWREQMFWMESLAPEPAECPNFDAISKEYHAARRAAKSQEDRDAAETRYVAEYDRIARQLRAYYSSPEGRRYWFSRRSYVLRFAQDGSFRVDDVPGGKYVLTLDPREPEADLSRRKWPVLDSYCREIDVPDSPGGRSDTPLDLGLINMVAQLMNGELAPDFSAKTLEDKTVKLSDGLGKYTLLVFWAAGNAPSAAAMPDLKETYEAFKNNPRFAMIGLSLDADAAAARAFAVKNNMDWTQGFLGPWSGSPLPEQYGVKDLPFVLLIDPTGRVFAGGLQGGNIKSAVDAALSHE
jgi:thiol-disulfide isomerase/thioredoxin